MKGTQKGKKEGNNKIITSNTAQRSRKTGRIMAPCAI